MLAEAGSTKAKIKMLLKASHAIPKRINGSDFFAGNAFLDFTTKSFLSEPIAELSSGGMVASSFMVVCELSLIFGDMN